MTELATKVIACESCGAELTETPAYNEETKEQYFKCRSCKHLNFIRTRSSDESERINRAKQLRLSKRFSEAEQAYNDILLNDGNDPEMLWGMVLSRYGVEYVEDTSGEYIPTLHRMKPVSVLADPDYLAAMENADAMAREQYEHDAKIIAEVQKKYNEIIDNEEPFDIFICYKETDADGRRTRDSVDAMDLYDRLTEKGFKVFFSRVTLEDKLGEEYEPYIYAALHSSKVMLAVGSKKEYFEAPWVKNEWSRYLEIIRGGDRKKKLIPVYKNIDPKDLPIEMQTLQGQDMSKLGYEQDIIRGIIKITGKNEPQQAQAAVQAAPVVETLEDKLANAEKLYKIGNKQSAEELYDSITKSYPDDYRGWIGLIRCRVTNYQGLENEDYINDLFGYAFQSAKNKEEEAYIEQIFLLSKKTSARQLSLYYEQSLIDQAEQIQLEVEEEDTQIKQYNSTIHKKQQFVEGERERRNKTINKAKDDIYYYTAKITSLKRRKLILTLLVLLMGPALFLPAFFNLIGGHWIYGLLFLVIFFIAVPNAAKATRKYRKKVNEKIGSIERVSLNPLYDMARSLKEEMRVYENDADADIAELKREIAGSKQFIEQKRQSLQELENDMKNVDFYALCWYVSECRKFGIPTDVYCSFR